MSVLQRRIQSNAFISKYVRAHKRRGAKVWPGKGGGARWRVKQVLRDAAVDYFLRGVWHVGCTG